MARHELLGLALSFRAGPQGNGRFIKAELSFISFVLDISHHTSELLLHVADLIVTVLQTLADDGHRVFRLQLEVKRGRSLRHRVALGGARGGGAALGTHT